MATLPQGITIAELVCLRLSKDIWTVKACQGAKPDDLRSSNEQAYQGLQSIPTVIIQALTLSIDTIKAKIDINQYIFILEYHHYFQHNN